MCDKNAPAQVVSESGWKYAYLGSTRATPPGVEQLTVAQPMQLTRTPGAKQYPTPYRPCELQAICNCADSRCSYILAHSSIILRSYCITERNIANAIGTIFTIGISYRNLYYYENVNILNKY